MVELTDEDDALIAELGLDLQLGKKPVLSPREERIIAGFEEIQKFVEEHGREPTFAYQQDAEKGIFERLYATRLEQLRRQPESIALIKERDHQNLLEDMEVFAGCSVGDFCRRPHCGARLDVSKRGDVRIIFCM